MNELPYLNLTGFSRLPMVWQDTTSECGLACLNMVANYYGHRVDLGELRRRYGASSRGTSLHSIRDIAAEIELGARGLRCELHELQFLRVPCILHWEMQHFVVLKKVTRSHVIIHDPAMGVRKMTFSEVDKAFSGMVLELTPTPNFQKRPLPNQLRLTDLLRFDGFFSKMLLYGLMVSFVAEIFMLISPFYMQMIIDDVLFGGDRPLLVVMAIGYGTAVVFQALTNVSRGLISHLMSHVMSFDMAARVFQKLVKLPLNYFTNRHTGDIQHRVKSLEQIEQFMTVCAPAMVMNVIFSTLILAFMFYYHTLLTFLVISAVALYALSRVLLFGVMRRAAGDVIVAEAAADTYLLETVRSMCTLKTMVLETTRESRWRNALSRKMDATLRLGNLEMLSMSISDLIFPGFRVALLYMLAARVTEGEFSIGMITAYAAYYAMFTQRAIALIEQTVQWKLLSVPLTRIADIAHSMPEQYGVDGGRDVELHGAVKLERVAFRYSHKEPLVLKSVSFKVEPGEFVAITGESGAGKSTIMALLAALEKPTSGNVLYDGRPVTHWSVQTLRRQLGVVLQNDDLMQGTLAENIASFREDIDMERVRDVARKCAIADDIEAMDMGYESHVGDMGSTLSSGQIQRILLARALHRNPKVLLLDEATSHLDQENENMIQQTLSQMNITRIVVAHRKETVAAADREIRIHGGGARVVPVKSGI